MSGSDNDNDKEEGKSSVVRFGGRLGIELSAATNVNLVAGPGLSLDPLANNNPLPEEVKIGSSQGGLHLESIAASGANSPPTQTVGMMNEKGGMGGGDGSSPGGVGVGVVASSPIPNNQRHKQRRKESWEK